MGGGGPLRTAGSDQLRAMVVESKVKAVGGPWPAGAKRKIFTHLT